MRRMIVLFFALCISLVARAGPNDILVIESYHAEFPWDASYKKGLREAIAQSYRLTFFEMDTKRVPPEQYPQRAKLAWEAYLRIQPRLVILGDDNALKYLAPFFVGTKTPVVYLGINKNPRDYVPASSKNFTGVLERPLMKRSIATVRKLINPSPRKVLVLFDSGTTSQASVEEAFRGRTELEIFGVTAELKLIGRWDDWQNVVRAAPAEDFDAIIVGLYHTIVDQDDAHVPADTVMSWTSENAPVPLFGFWDFAVGKGKTAGGLVLYGYEQGIAAGRIAMQIFDGSEPHKIFPKTSKKGRFLFSKSEFERDNLSLPGSLAEVAAWID